jgi:hypothetical protein
VQHAAVLAKQLFAAYSTVIFLPLGVEYTAVVPKLSTLSRYCLLNVGVHQTFSRNVPISVADVECATLTT